MHLTNYFNRFFVVKFFVPVEQPQKRKGGQKNEANSKEHVACKAGKVDPLQNTKQWSDFHIQGKTILKMWQTEPGLFHKKTWWDVTTADKLKCGFLEEYLLYILVLKTRM